MAVNQSLLMALFNKKTAGKIVAGGAIEYPIY
jgi:hypothetical protein